MNEQALFDAQELSLQYDKQRIVDNLSLRIQPHKITVLIGPNGCGKSTLLKGLARQLPATNGQLLFNGQAIASQSTKSVAKALGILPQSPTTFESITVAELVALGRYPHQQLFQQWSAADQKALDTALAYTQLTDFIHSPVDTLSGGQRQRAWIAMTLAQQTPTLLLDEPTTYLDLAHQIDILNLLQFLNKTQQRSVVMVLHDLNLACRYADELIVMKAGTVVAQGSPQSIMTPTLLQSVFNLDCHIINDPLSATPLCIPHVDNPFFQQFSISEEAQ